MLFTFSTYNVFNNFVPCVKARSVLQAPANYFVECKGENKLYHRLVILSLRN